MASEMPEMVSFPAEVQRASLPFGRYDIAWWQEAAVFERLAQSGYMTVNGQKQKLWPLDYESNVYPFHHHATQWASRCHLDAHCVAWQCAY